MNITSELRDTPHQFKKLVQRTGLLTVVIFLSCTHNFLSSFTRCIEVLIVLQVNKNKYMLMLMAHRSASKKIIHAAPKKTYASNIQFTDLFHLFQIQPWFDHSSCPSSSLKRDLKMSTATFVDFLCNESSLLDN